MPDNSQEMTQEQGVIEILAGRIAELEKENANLKVGIIVKNQEIEALKGTASGGSE